MIRISLIVVLAILGLNAFGLFHIKYQVKNLRHDLEEVNFQIAQEKEAIHVLKAEWTYLNQPDRLRQLATKYLTLEKTKVSQLAKMENDIPLLVPGLKKGTFLAQSGEQNKTSNVKQAAFKQKTVHGKLRSSDKPVISSIKY
jgi:cell division protein FtsL